MAATLGLCASVAESYLFTAAFFVTTGVESFAGLISISFICAKEKMLNKMSIIKKKIFIAGEVSLCESCLPEHYLLSIVPACRTGRY